MSNTRSEFVRKAGRFFWPVFRVVLILAGILVIAGGAAAIWFWKTSEASLPQLDGEIRLEGLLAPVTVVRDGSGTPHIHAQSLDDLFFAQGFVTAQDRLYQMDLMRRNAAGELSEVLGSPLVRGAAAARLLEFDKVQRYLQVRWAAENSFRHASATASRYLNAYASGVNAFLKNAGEKLPIEFRILGYRPKPWQASDSILVGMNISQQMNSQFRVEWWRDRFSQRLPRALLDELYPNDSPKDRAPGEVAPRGPRDLHPSANIFPFDPIPLLKQAPLLPTDEEPLAAASNNWVVSGLHTMSGKPLLSNDMHLPHSLPGVWYQAHLTAADCDVIGYTLPGIPFVIGGHNRRIAWGFTNMGPDVQDLYVEAFNQKGEYQTPSGWTRPEVRREIIRVKDRPDIQLDIEVTRHGPVITPIVAGETRRIALKWIVYEPIAQDLPFLALNLARNWEEFRNALSGYVAPAMNLVYADVDGNVGYQASGRIPIRTSGDGLSLAPGHTGTNEWAGFIPWEEMPSVYNPPSGVLVTANSRITPHGYKYMVANQWVAPLRTRRIYEVLEERIRTGKKLSPADMLALQTDVFSEHDRMIALALARSVRSSAQASLRAREAAEILEKWDGRITPDSAGAALVSLSRRTLSRMVLQPRLGDEWFQYRWFGSATFWEHIVADRCAYWLPPEFADYDALLLAVVERTVSASGIPSRLGNLGYGEFFPLMLNHPIFGEFPILGSYSGPGRVEQRGNGNTVCQAAGGYGPSQRLSVDLGDLDNSTSNIVTGQSGQMGSPHYMDHFPHWLNGTTLPLPFSEPAVAAATRHRLQLRP